MYFKIVPKHSMEPKACHYTVGQKISLGVVFVLGLIFTPNEFQIQTASSNDYLSSELMVRAQKLHFMLTGTSLVDEAPYRPLYLEAIRTGDLKQAAELLTDPRFGSRYFYDMTVRNFAITFNREETFNIPANDLTAFVIGLTRDDEDYTKLLTAEFFYTDPTATNNAYAPDSNAHFNDIDRFKSFRDSLRKTFSGAGEIGIFTRRRFAEDFYDMGTKRRPWKAIVNLLYLKKLDEIATASIPDAYVRRDLPRVGADGTTHIYQDTCRTCHAQMDPVSFAFGVFDYNTNNVPNALERLASFRDFINETNGPVYKPINDSWWLYVTDAQNEVFGFNDVAGTIDIPSITFSPLGNGLRLATGQGLRSLARVVAGSHGLARGLVTRVVCQMYLKKVWSLPNITSEDWEGLRTQNAVIERLMQSFVKHKKLRILFEEVAREYLE